MIYERQNGVPKFAAVEFQEKKKDYVLLIPVINEGERLHKELARADHSHISDYADIIICDGGSTDSCVDRQRLRERKVCALLVKQDTGKQGAQLRMGIWWALYKGYLGIITIDGNNKDNIEAVPAFIEKLKEGFDFVQGSRFIKGGRAIRTPFIRYICVRFIHSPIISLTAGWHFTDTTNAYRAYSLKYLQDDMVAPLRDIFMGYELLAYLSVRASQLKYRVCELPVVRAYPRHGKTPTKISFFKGNWELMAILIKNAMGKYNPKSAGKG